MPSPPAVVLTTERLLVTELEPDDAPRMAAYFQRNGSHLERWDPPRPEGFLTAAYWRRQLAQNREDHGNDVALRLSLLDRAEPAGAVLGQCNFTQIFRGPLQACTVGFSLDRDAVGRGLMAEALRAALGFVWTDLGLHRVQANYQPINERSGRLLRRLGFVVEGYARDYLYIAGAWRDHVLTSLTRPEALDARRPPPPL